jgi:hypothetical protein
VGYVVAISFMACAGHGAHVAPIRSSAGCPPVCSCSQGCSWSCRTARAKMLNPAERLLLPAAALPALWARRAPPATERFGARLRYALHALLGAQCVSGGVRTRQPCRRLGTRATRRPGCSGRRGGFRSTSHGQQCGQLPRAIELMTRHQVLLHRTCSRIDARPDDRS